VPCMSALCCYDLMLLCSMFRCCKGQQEAPSLWSVLQKLCLSTSRSRGLKLNRWITWEGWNRPCPWGHLNGDIGSLEPNSTKSNHRIFVCVWFFLQFVIPSPLSNFSCIGFDSNLKCCSQSLFRNTLSKLCKKNSLPTLIIFSRSNH
jgi:hypothetical protein